MPIATIVVSDAAPQPALPVAGLVERWSAAAGLPATHMTVNLLPRAAQVGARFDVMAFLFLPTLWSEADVAALQLGLAGALAETFATDPAAVQVVTTMVGSGHAATGAGVETW